MSNVCIKEIGILEYFTKLSTLRTALSDFYIKTRNCCIIAAFDEMNQALGILIAEQKNVVEILFITSSDGGFETKKQMLDFLLALHLTSDYIRWRIIGRPDDEKFALDYGFRFESTLHLFRTFHYSDEIANSFLKRFYRLSDSVEKRGYNTVCFSELTNEQKEQIRKDPDHEFAPELHPELLIDDYVGGISMQYSTVAIKDGKVIAYSIVRAPSKNRCIFEILCVAKSQRKSGVIILPIVRTIKELLIAGYDSMTFAIYDRNKEMLSVIDRNFSGLIESCNIQHNMLFHVGGK